MKKLLLALTLTLGLAACGDSNQPVAAKPIKTVDQQQQRQDNLATEAVASLRKMASMLHQAKTSDEYTICIEYVPKLQAQMRYLNGLMEKLDEAHYDPSLMAMIRRSYAELDGDLSVVNNACSTEY